MFDTLISVRAIQRIGGTWSRKAKIFPFIGTIFQVTDRVTNRVSCRSYLQTTSLLTLYL